MISANFFRTVGSVSAARVATSLAVISMLLLVEIATVPVIGSSLFAVGVRWAVWLIFCLSSSSAFVPLFPNLISIPNS